MFYPQSNFYPQSFNPQALNQFNPQPFNPQGNQPGFNPAASTGQIGQIPFANTLYGYPPQYPTPYPNSQQAQQQLAALQHHALQLLAHQLAAQQLGAQNFPGAGAMAGFSNGAVGPGVQQQAQQQQPHQHLLQQLAQYHYLIAQQISQLAAQQAFQTGGGAYSGQFIPGQLGSSYQPGSNYLSGGTMH